MGKVGIRREDKSRFERRAPLSPAKMKESMDEDGTEYAVQPSEIRIFGDDEYRDLGGFLQEDLSDCDIILGVKEVPTAKLIADMAYLFFSHTIKGQDYNMPMLQRLLDLNCTLIDYERIADPQGRRLVFFGYHAGLAGMIDTLWVMGERLAAAGTPNPFQEVKQALEFRDLQDACLAVSRAGERIKTEGIPEELGPMVVGFSGYGNVSMGAQFVFDHLPFQELQPHQVPSLFDGTMKSDPHTVYKVVYREEHMAARKDGSEFQLLDYFEHPELYEGIFHNHVPYLSVLVNCIYWDTPYPRLVTRKQLRELAAAGSMRMLAIGDISCDIDGSVEMTTKATGQEKPALIYDPATDEVLNQMEGPGVAIVAVDNLPAELPRDSTDHFGDSLGPFLNDLANLDRGASFEELKLCPELKGAIIAWNGVLTPEYEYIRQYL